MKRMFLYFYAAIVALFLGVGGLSYLVLEYVNDQRYIKHLDNHLLPVAKLISAGLVRQREGNTDEWLALVQELMSMNVKVKKSACASGKVISTLPTQERAYETCFNSGENTSIVFNLEALNEQLFSTMAFLVLNELGTVSADKRQNIFNEIKSSSPFPVYRSARMQDSLSAKQRSLLSQGRVIVQWTKQFDKAGHLMVLAPWGNTSDSLVLGPIPLFETYTKDQIYLIICLALVLLASLVSLVLKQLTKTIKDVHADINNISRDKLGLSTASREVDSIASIGETIEELVDRIKNLLQEKNYAIRAISHDLRTPISRMLFRVETLSESQSSSVSEPLRRDLLHMESLIKQLLSYEQLSTSQRVSTQPHDLKVLCGELIDGYRETSPNLQFLMTAQCYPEKLKVPIDRELIYRALDNLLQNACRYANETVIVELQLSLGNVGLSVVDDGPGLPNVSDTRELFEPFYKGDESRGESKVGFGFGLAIVKKIAAVHGGAVLAENLESKGARFTIELPLGMEPVTVCDSMFDSEAKDASS